MGPETSYFMDVVIIDIMSMSFPIICPLPLSDCSFDGKRNLDKNVLVESTHGPGSNIQYLGKYLLGLRPVVHSALQHKN